MSSSIGIPIRDGSSLDDLYSPAKQKAANRGGVSASYRRAWLLLTTRSKLLAFLCLLSVAVLTTSNLSSLMGWCYPPSPTTPAYTVLINTWKRNSPLKQTVSHYASCHGAALIHVAWTELDPPPDNLKAYLDRVMSSKSKPEVVFHVNSNDDGESSSRFKPIDEGLRTEAVFSVDDGVIVPCSDLEFAFQVWRTAPGTMVGFVPRMHWLDNQDNARPYYKFGGWWSVWWMGTYSMVLSKAAFFHKKYLGLYARYMPPSIRDYVARQRNCEDIAMSMLVANATGAAPVWVKGKVHEIGSPGISSLSRYSDWRNDCLNDLISLYGLVPLVSTNAKTVDGRHEWSW